MSSMVNVFVHAMCKRSKKCLAQKVDNLGSLKLIHMIQSLLNSSCVVLQYKSGTNFFFFIEQFLSYTATKKPRNFSTTAWHFCTYSVKILDYLKTIHTAERKYQADEYSLCLSKILIWQCPTMDAMKNKSDLLFIVMPGKPETMKA